MKSARFIYYSGLEWKQFDFPKGLDALIHLQNSEFLFYAGVHWKIFDTEKGGKTLIHLKDLPFIYKAGAMWNQFDYENGWRELERSVREGSKWRGEAFENQKWKSALHRIWQNICTNQLQRK